MDVIFTDHPTCSKVLDLFEGYEIAALTTKTSKKAKAAIVSVRPTDGSTCAISQLSSLTL